MITVEQALEQILGYVRVLEAESAPLLDSLGQVLAEDVVSEISIPPLDNAAMDGFAIQSRDTAGAGADSPRILQVIDTVIAGSISGKKVGPGTAVRIMTGAPVPEGADSVVRFEDTDEDRRRQAGQVITQIGILCPVAPGLNIRRAGEDVTRGTTVLVRDTRVRPAEAGVLASLGREQVRVIRRPRIAVLATGNELVELGRPLPPGKIYNSNTYSVAAQVKRYGGVPLVLGIAPDDKDALVRLIRRGLAADMIITSGGVSAGDDDMVKDVLARDGEVTFWTVRMKPGKPLAFGVIRGDIDGVPRSVPHLGLPGNPVSAMVTFELFGRAALLKMMGYKDLSKPVIEATLEGRIVNSEGRRVFTRAVVERRADRYVASLTGPQGSGILTSMSRANGLIVTPEDVKRMDTGDTVKVMMLDWDQRL
ncbi:MAG: molybdopterin molybdotransferase MoeA [Chloroflexi bacterium]|nr:molybdopterin molybdotransferase MoeA [Chloroflexota bacterium]